MRLELLPLELSDGSDGGVEDATDSGIEDATDGNVNPKPCVEDDDGDGVDNCLDRCPNDPEKSTPAVCGCGVSDMDHDGDGTPDCSAVCDEASYIPDSSCGEGYCQTHNTPSSCVDGRETECLAGAPLSIDDRTQDGVDDDCDGLVDEDACTPHTETFGAGSHTSTPGACTTAVITIWGGGGASGDSGGGYWGAVRAGTGGSGGYVQTTVRVNAASVLALSVGTGGQGCGSAGTNPDAFYNGGAGATSRSGTGAQGSGGARGGEGGSGGGDGGEGNYGGGGGGAGGGPPWNPYGGGGGGGGATFADVDNTLLVAGGGGGGGGTGSNITSAGEGGGSGGAGCSGGGANGSGGSGGGGGGGGACDGASVSQGSGRAPHDPEGLLPAGTATGGDTSSDCAAGGDGYAIVTYSP